MEGVLFGLVAGLLLMLGMIGYFLDMIRFALERIERKIK